MRVKFNEEQKQMRKKISKNELYAASMCVSESMVKKTTPKNHKSKRKPNEEKERHSLVFIPHETGFLMEIRALLHVLLLLLLLLHTCYTVYVMFI